MGGGVCDCHQATRRRLSNDEPVASVASGHAGKGSDVKAAG